MKKNVADNYEDRWHPTYEFCPECENKHPPRTSIIERQQKGDGWLFRCSDYSVCDWTFEGYDLSEMR